LAERSNATDAFDITREPQHIRDMYGADKSTQARDVRAAQPAGTPILDYRRK